MADSGENEEMLHGWDGGSRNIGLAQNPGVIASVSGWLRFVPNLTHLEPSSLFGRLQGGRQLAVDIVLLLH